MLAFGWYSHSVLATVLQNSTPSPWKLLFKPLEMTDYRRMLDDELICGAVVNQNNYHWIALVKHNGLLWHVDSRYSPWAMDEDAFRVCLKSHPSTFAVARRERPGD